MRSEMEKAQKAEQRLRAGRDEWRLMAENLQAAGGNDEGEEGENHVFPNPTMTTTAEVCRARLVRAQIVTPLMETILMEVMIRSSRKLRFLVVKLTKLWYHLSQRCPILTIGWLSVLQMFSAHAPIPTKKSG